ncbi:hypothetical protein LTR95_015390, partial [Oleoguttula sp. CCFEE 5521]
STPSELPAPLLPPFDADVLPGQATETSSNSAYYLGQRSGLQPGQTAYTCQEEACGEIFDTVAKLRRHAKKHDEELMHKYKCPIQERDPHRCASQGFSKPTDVERHLLSHSDPQFHCRKGCGDFLYRFDHRTRHEEKCNGQPKKRSKAPSNARSLAGSADAAFAASSAMPYPAAASAQAMQRAASDYHPVGYGQQVPMTPANLVAPSDRFRASQTGSMLSSFGTTPGSFGSEPSRVFTNDMLNPTSTPFTGQTPGSLPPRPDTGYFGNVGYAQDYSTSPSLRKQ